MDLIGLDTCVLIHHFERHPEHFEATSRVFSAPDAPARPLRAVCSVLVRAFPHRSPSGRGEPAEGR